MSPRDFAIQQVIDNMWEKYDVDRSGALDREETKNFVRYTLLDMNADDSFDDAAFEHVFNHFDKDGNGTIDKDEMLMFLKQNYFSCPVFNALDGKSDNVAGALGKCEGLEQQISQDLLKIK